MGQIIDIWLSRPNLITFILIFLWGLYIMIAHHNLIKKLIGMYLVQTSVIFFFVTISAKSGATVPILFDDGAMQPVQYANPLPHVLMLTAIVVGVATLGVSLALVIAIYRQYQSLDEEEILSQRLE
ncbi:MAG: cation:proton antiporter subunit C [Nitrospirota bacterium]|nr:MAG: cation:proton antiporter subunit C [Nitrospirota bacterium]